MWYAESVFEGFGLFFNFMIHEGHDNFFVIFQVIFDELVELGLSDLPLLTFLFLLDGHISIFLGLLLDIFEGGQFPLNIQNFLDCFLLFMFHIVNSRLDGLHLKSITWMAFSVYLLRICS